MNFKDKIAALPPLFETTAELSQATGLTSLGMLLKYRNESLLARNALLCDALRFIAVDYLDYDDESAMNLIASVLKGCEVLE